MEAKQNGGAAFPSQGHSDKFGMRSFPAAAGMTLRDYFAATALPAVLAVAYSGRASNKDGGPLTEESLAVQAYHFADAMLAAREAP